MRMVLSNTSDRYGMVALVTFKDFLCGEPLANFFVYLTPVDVWVGNIKSYGGTVKIESVDNSIVVNNKVGSTDNKIAISLSKPSNPHSTPLFGYVEVKTLAYVDTSFVGKVGNATLDYYSLMREQGFTEEHLFMAWLFQEGSEKYNDVAYVVKEIDNQTISEFNGLIFPSDEHFDFAGNNPMVSDGVINPDLEDGVLQGKMEVLLDSSIIGSYKAVAVKDFSMLGDDVLATPDFDYDHDYNEHYKPSQTDGAYLDSVGYTDYLDAALDRTRIFVNYDSSSNGTTQLLVMLFPTKQLEYDKITDKCVASVHTSDVWQESLKLETHKLDVELVGPKGEKKWCVYSPCVWDDTAMLFLPSGDFDPFFYNWGQVVVFFGNNDNGDFEFASLENGHEQRTWSEVGGLPVVPIFVTLSPNGIFLEYPTFTTR